MSITEISGLRNSAKVFTDVIDDASIAQLRTMLDQDFAAGSQICIMPDVHAGAGCTIGTTMTIRDKICPNLVGVDIGCGVYVAKLYGEVKCHLADIDDAIRKFIPSGFRIHDEPRDFPALRLLRCAEAVDTDRAYRSIGSLGGGNHFIEIDKDESGNCFLLIHSGSRHLGLEVANYYQKQAIKNLKRDDLAQMIQSLKEQGREKEISAAVKKAKSERQRIPDALAYVEGSLFDDYLHDMEIVQRFADHNRFVMAALITEYTPVAVEYQFSTVHNYIDTDSMVLRKGAVSARAGERLIIPINMRDGSLLCLGKGNEDWNCSAPHGAGRIMSRAKAKAAFTVDEFAAQMAGVYTTSVDASTLDECPMAYKSIDAITDNIGDTVEVIDRLSPIYNFKAGEE